ncbi:hypothetical protein PTKIN_Ptkin16aG0080100 [Pterospermum kingtungense]
MEGHNMHWSAIVGDNVLKGHENYANWRACIKSYMRSRDLWDVVEETTTSEPPKQQEISNEADLKAWEKKDASALHAIQISCAPTMLSYIRDKTTAKDAWYTLAEKCQPPPMSAENAQGQPDMELDECEETPFHDVNNNEEEMRRKGQQQRRHRKAYDNDQSSTQRVQCAQQ